MNSHKSKLPNLETTIFSTMSALASKHNAINLSQGFPNFDSDMKLNNLVHGAMLIGHNQYAPMAGLIELRVQISQKYEKMYNVSYHPESEITVSFVRGLV